MSKKEIEEAYAISRRIEGEERALEAAVSVTTSTQQEIDEQWNLYDGRAPPRLAPLLGWRQPRRGVRSQRQRDKDAESILGRQPCFFSIYTQDWLSQRQGMCVVAALARKWYGLQSAAPRECAQHGRAPARGAQV